MRPEEFGNREPIKQPIPENKNDNPKDKVKDYVKKANPALKHYGKQIVDRNLYNLIKVFLVIFGIAVLGFGLMAYNGDFKTDVICPDTNITIPECPEVPECPSCPSTNCSPTLNCPSIPNNFSVNIVNESN